MNNPESLTIYRASAGSGKTFVLVRDYLKITLGKPEQFRHILAITFTNKAAQEMKLRIIEALRAFSSDHTLSTSDHHLFEYLRNTLGFSDEQLRTAAQKLLITILHEYSDFAVSTIDSFMQRILKAFATDTGLPISFSMELDSMRVAKSILERLYNAIDQNEELSDFLIQWAQERSSEGKTHNLDSELLRFIPIIFEENHAAPLERIKTHELIDFVRLRNTIRHQMSSITLEWQNKLKQIVDEIVSLGLTDEDFYRKTKGVLSFIKKSFENPFNIEPNQYVVAALTDRSLVHPDSSKKDILKTIEHKILQLIDQYLTVQKKITSYDLINKALPQLTLMRTFTELYDQFRDEELTIHISEVNHHINKIVRSEPVPYIYEFISSKYSHFFLDEFQDTSAMQWQNLVPLIHESLSYGTYRHNLIVGDVKQSIYRWRGGRAEILANLPYLTEKIKLELEEGDAIESKFLETYKIVNLNTNYRSKEVIVNFNNRFFEFLKTSHWFKFNHYYDQCAQETASSQTGGYVKIEFLTQNDSNSELYYEAALKTKKIIQTCCEELKYSPHDIAILVRSQHEAIAISDILSEYQIPITTEESLLLRNAPKVRYLIAFLHWVHNPKNKNHLATWLTLAAQLTHRHQDFFQNIFLIGHSSQSIPEIFDFAINELKLDTSIRKINEQPLHEALLTLIYASHHIIGATDQFVECFVKIALEYAQTQSLLLNEFLNYWEENNETLALRNDGLRSGVRIMTVHKSKGLEFPVVIIPIADWSLSSTGKNKLWVNTDPERFFGMDTLLIPEIKKVQNSDFYEFYENEKELLQLDAINLLYVAMTRSRDHLYIMCPTPTANSDKENVRNVGEIISQFVIHESSQLNTYEAGSSAYSNQTQHVKEQEKNLVYTQTETVKEKPWRSWIQLQSRFDNPSDLDTLWYGDKNTRWGNLIHFVLVQMSRSEDLMKAIEHFKKISFVNEEEAHHIHTVLTRFFENKSIVKLFDATAAIIRESEFFDTEGQLRRFDRMQIENDRITIIDFKTGQKKDTHVTQMQSYMKPFVQIHHQKVQGALLYIDPPEIVEVHL
ncbi:MAG TPA: UvrD-helicase domain-containing protein [bacterium]|nr:UvrD-helicase domain-containing protein [bacterium]HND77174.1 UvrD-helicase domain-containing protein [bacterium]HNO10570.1 UvrD-helicase domain-containing protein [bacterium]HNO89519.1 UvrD-helicase domain-containing protein [bacterium]